MQNLMFKSSWLIAFLMLSQTLNAQQELLRTNELQINPVLIKEQSYQQKMMGLNNPPVPEDYPVNVIVKFKDVYPIRGVPIANIKPIKSVATLNKIPIYGAIDVATKGSKFTDSHNMVLASHLVSGFEFQKTIMQKKGFLKNYTKSNNSIDSQLLKVNSSFDDQNIIRIRSFVQTDISVFREARRKARHLSDLENSYIVTFPPNSDYPNNFLEDLKKIEIVETAYVAPFPQNADIAPPTDNFQGLQGYLNAINVNAAWNTPGGIGSGVTIADIEFAWQLNHEDLGTPVFEDYGLGAAHIPVGDWKSHGTSVLGIMVALNDGVGVTGISHGADFAVVSIARSLGLYSVADSILFAIRHLSPGDIILIEQHAPDFTPFNTSNDETACTCNCSQHRYLPMEFWNMEFRAIEYATQMGILVVEAAGNGAQNLNHPNFEGKFFRDSGAILVGSGQPNSRVPICSSNSGNAVDMHAWGRGIRTTGGTDDNAIKVNGDDRRQWYNPNFGGTSGASPIVVGAAANLQGIRLERGGLPMSPTEIRELLIDTGTAQATDPRNIGPLPNLEAAVNGLLPVEEPLVGNSCSSSAAISDECNGNECRLEQHWSEVTECSFLIFCDTFLVRNIDEDEFLCVDRE